MKIRKTILASMTIALFAQPLAAEICGDKIDYTVACQPVRCQPQFEDVPGNKEYCADIYWDGKEVSDVISQDVERTNEEYCAEIYWEDEYNCVMPGQIVTKGFCESIVFEDTQAVCFEHLRKQNKVTAENCEDMGYASRIKTCLDYVKHLIKKAK